jgi:carboxypeptidase T
MAKKTISLLIYLTALSAFAAKEEATFFVEIIADDVTARNEVASIIHIDQVSDSRIFSVVSEAALPKLSRLKKAKLLAVEVASEKPSDEFSAFAGVIDFPDNDARFHTYNEMLAALRKIVSDRPDLAQLESIGRSVEGKELWALKISDATRPANGDKPAIVFMGTHHAREHLSTEMPIMFAEDIIKKYDTDQEIRSLLSRIEIYFIPMVNPDGAMYDIEGKRYKWWRKNRKNNGSGVYGVDLNRNYGYGWGTGGSSSSPSSDVYMGPAPFSEPESKAVRDFFVAHSNVTIALSFHTFSELILYPWGGRDDGIGGADEALFKRMANDMAAMNKYRPMQSSELYIASGDTCDWLYGERQVYCMTFELSPSSMWDGGFYPGASIIDRVYNDNRNPMLYLLRLTEDPKIALRD